MSGSAARPVPAVAVQATAIPSNATVVPAAAPAAFPKRSELRRSERAAIVAAPRPSRREEAESARRRSGYVPAATGRRVVASSVGIAPRPAGRPAVAGSARSGKAIRNRTSAAMVMFVVAGIAVTSAMPAVAVAPSAAAVAAAGSEAPAQAQSFVAMGAVSATVTRDSFNAEAKPEPVAIALAGGAAGTAEGGGSATAWVLPSVGRVSDSFGPRPDRPVSGVNSFHAGTDIAVGCGTPVVAAAGGTVEESKYFGTYGNWVLIDHGNGIETGYAHNSSLLVDVGDVVEAGELIALAGSTGASTGCHVHFETRVDGEKVDPQPFMATAGVPLG